MRSLLLGAAALAFAVPASQAQEVTLRVHHFMGDRAALHSELLTNWAEELANLSQGRIAVDLFPAMSLGGAPGDLYDQAADGAVDIVLTLPGYTAGRFHQSEVFELPFMMSDPIATSKALWAMIDQDLQDSEFEEVQVLTSWVHGPGIIHSKIPIRSLEDMAGVELRGPTRLITDLIDELGATPVGMPLPDIPESLSKGVISAATLPWEITPAIRLSELVDYATEMGGDKALYTATFILAMNLDAYDSLPDDLRAILDSTTGTALAVAAAEIMVSGDVIGRQIAESNGIEITTLGDAEVTRWVEAAQPVYEAYISQSTDEGFDGAATLARARALISENM